MQAGSRDCKCVADGTVWEPPTSVLDACRSPLASAKATGDENRTSAATANRWRCFAVIAATAGTAKDRRSPSGSEATLTKALTTDASTCWSCSLIWISVSRRAPPSSDLTVPPCCDLSLLFTFRRSAKHQEVEREPQISKESTTVPDLRRSFRCDFEGLNMGTSSRMV